MRTIARFDPLVVRLAVGTSLLVTGPLLIGLFALQSSNLEHTIQAHRRAADLQARLLESALARQMVTKDHEQLAQTLREVEAQPEVRGVMIVDLDGGVSHSSDAAIVGTKIALESPSCIVCHAQAPADRERWVVVEQADERVLRTVLPILNRPECHRCHDASQGLNGVLILDTSLARVDERLKRNGRLVLLGAAALILILLAGTRFLVTRLVLVRLAELGEATRSFSAGNLSQRAPGGGTDVIAQLAADFNTMASEISCLVNEVQEKQRQMTKVLNSLDDGLVVFDQEHCIVVCNHSFWLRSGQSPDTLSGWRPEDSGASLLHAPSGADGPVRQCFSTGEVQRAIYQAGGVDEENRIVEQVYASPIFDDAGEVIQVVEIWRDITQRAKEQESLAEIERLSSLGVLASGFSHEVNTPLASILTCAESIIGQTDDSAVLEADESVLGKLNEHARTIRDEVLRCSRITDQFRRFSRGIPPAVEPFDLVDVVESIVSLVSPTARRAMVRLQLDAAEALPPVAANVEVVQHVVLNLLINAIQSFGEQGGSVVITFSEEERDVRIRILDTGRGIEPRMAKDLFGPFRSQKRQGTGLGLFLSRTFMRRFGGDVRLVSSEVGIGSCFEIVFRPLESSL